MVNTKILHLLIIFHTLLSKNTNVIFYGQHNPITFAYSINETTSFKNPIHTYGYASPTDGSYVENSVQKSTGVDYRTVERYKEYKAAGMDTLLLQGNDPYRGNEVWETCQTKKNLDNAQSAGINRAIVFDNRIYQMSQGTTALVGHGYSSIADLADTLRSYIADYSTHPIFAGVMLIDEPSTINFAAIHDIQNAINLIDEDIECYVNLLPYYANKNQLFTNGESVSLLTQYKAYSKYVEDFITGGTMKSICMDSYPYRYDSSKRKNYFETDHFPGIQILAEMAKKYNIKPSYVLQTFGSTEGSDGDPIFVQENEMMIRYLFNTTLAFSPASIGYFTYWRKQNSTQNDWYTDGASFITQTGEKTPLYTWVQNIYNETNLIRKEISKYSYDCCKFYNTSIDGSAVSSTIPGLTISTLKEFMVVYLTNGADKMYAIVNVEDVFSQSGKKSSISISSKANTATIYSNGECNSMDFSSKLTFSLGCGEAIFVKVQ